MDAEAACTAAEALLDRERDLLRLGRIDELAPLLAERDRVLAAATGADVERLRRLRAKAERNGRLASAAADGIRAALSRVRELARAAGPIGSYSATGESLKIGAIRPTCERKA